LASLEPLIVAPVDLPKALADLTGRAYLDEVVVLSTCMRTEVYAVVNRFHGAMADIREFLATWSGQPPEEFAGHLYSYFDEAAVTHLFRVACGLDSASVGEPEILGQVKSAWEAARRDQACGPLLAATFNHAVQVGKRARTETAIARGSTSVSYAAAEMVEAALGPLDGKVALVIGLGEVGETAARALAEVPRRGRVLLANRSPARSRHLAAELDAQAVPWEEVSGAVAEADVVVCGTTGEGLLVTEEMARQALAARRGRPMVLVDLAVPRDVDPRVGDLDGATLFNMDDIARYVASRVGDRQGEVPAVERIVAEEVERYHATVAARSVAPLVSALHDKAEQVRRTEMARYQNRSGGPEETDDAIDAMTRRIVAKLLHDPTVNLKAAAGTAKGDALAEAFRELFGLPS
jgi:glutamyl-tRNA reductase